MERRDVNLCVSIELYTETIYDGAFIQSPVLTNVIPSLASRNQSPLLLGANFLKTPLKKLEPAEREAEFRPFRPSSSRSSGAGFSRDENKRCGFSLFGNGESCASGRDFHGCWACGGCGEKTCRDLSCLTNDRKMSQSYQDLSYSREMPFYTFEYTQILILHILSESIVSAVGV